MEVLYEEPGAFIGLSWEDNLKVWMIHLHCTEWSPSEFKRQIKVWEMLRIDLRARGITEVYGLAADAKAVKFNKMFGATTTGHVVEDEDGNLNALIKMET